MADKKTSSFILMIISALVLFSIVTFNTFIFFANVLWLNVLLYIVVGGLFILTLTGYFLKKEIYFKLGVTGTGLITIIYLIYYILLKTNILDQIDSFDDLRQLILSFGGWGLFTYIIINLLQCVLIPIPTTLTVLVGSAIYGPGIAFIYAIVGVIIGSSISFMIGRYCSRPIINWIFGKEKVDKYQDMLKNRTSLIVFLTLLLPLFPDDLICMLAGVTEIKYRKFLIISIFARGIGLATISYFGSGTIIPFNSWWGITLWCVIGLLLIAMLVLAYKKRERIKAFLRIRR